MPSPIGSKTVSPVKTRSFLAWSAWQRVLVVLPALVLLWLAVAWALFDMTAWSATPW